MITTAREMYIAFLHGIQKEDAEGVPAEKFNYWINKAQEDWLTERSRLFDADQKRIDDLYLLRTERTINTNGTRTVLANTSLRLLSDGTGTLLVDTERYFNVSGLYFFSKSGDTTTIDHVTGEVTSATTGDIFYALVWYSELSQPVVSKITIGATPTGTHTGELLDEASEYLDFIANAVYNKASTGAAGTAFTEAAFGISWPGTPAAPLPVLSFTDYRFLVPNGYPNPRYFRLQSVLFKITYVDNAIFPDGISNWLKAQLLRADQRADIYQNAYRYPTDEKPYYRLLGEFIEFVNETDSTPLQMKIEYLRYPDTIKYVEPASDDVAVDCNLNPVQQKEIVDIAVRMYIEATQSPRYQTQVVEEQIKDKFE